MSGPGDQHRWLRLAGLLFLIGLVGGGAWIVSLSRTYWAYRDSIALQSFLRGELLRCDRLVVTVHVDGELKKHSVTIVDKNALHELAGKLSVVSDPDTALPASAICLRIEVCNGGETSTTFDIVDDLVIYERAAVSINPEFTYDIESLLGVTIWRPSRLREAAGQERG